MTLEQFLALSDDDRAKLHRADRAACRILYAEKDLRPLAAQASPSPWYRSHGAVTCAMKRDAKGALISQPLEERFLFNVERERGYHGTDADARWICAAEPSRIIAVLDHAQQIMAERDALKLEVEALRANQIPRFPSFSDGQSQ